MSEREEGSVVFGDLQIAVFCLVRRDGMLDILQSTRPLCLSTID